jgi:3,4-dihydroxy 2-butanone 4-phosphate synthase/GTP cyclohydrolase II
MAEMSTVERAIEATTRGEVTVVVDDEDRENEGDLIMAAEAATPEKLGFFLRHTSGVICAALEPERCDSLRLPPMVSDNREAQGTAFTVSVDAATGTTTGISAADRARTLTTLAAPETSPEDLVRPGHVFPLRSAPAGVLKRAGHTEASVDLARLAGRMPVGVLSEVVSPDKRRMANGPELARLADEHGLPLVTIAQLVRHRLARESVVEHVAQARIPTVHGEFVCHAWRSTLDGSEHLALVRGDVRGGDPVLVRVHSECVTGDVIGSTRCDCGSQLADALAAIAAAGRGVIVYLRGHEGRGIGIVHKLRAYGLQDLGHDTVDANVLLGVPVDGRQYGVGAQILADLGVERMRLLTNNPAKYRGLAGYGLEIVERVPLPPRTTAENVRYLEAKHRRMGHRWSDADAWHA